MAIRTAEVEENQVVQTLLRELMSAPPQPFPPPRKRLEAPTAQGVYVIYERSGRVVHVGRTPRGSRGIRQRLANHLHNLSSFTNKYLNGRGSELRDGYMFRCLVVEDPRKRALLEAYATGCLCPAHLGLGQAS
jgi:hypothetical protein